MLAHYIIMAAAIEKYDPSNAALPALPLGPASTAWRRRKAARVV